MTPGQTLTEVEAKRLRLLEQLRQRDYDFVPITPESQHRVLGRAPMAMAEDLRGIFGWSLPFEEQTMDAEMFRLMQEAELIEAHPRGFISKARVSRLRGLLYLHSEFPTEKPDSVFLGPDSWRFVDFVLDTLSKKGAFERLVDIGAGAGVGGISVAAHLTNGRVELADINKKALGFARVNAAAAKVDVDLLESDGLKSIAPGFDVAIANPPFIFEEDAPAYRRGGRMHGAELSRDWTLAAAQKLAPGGYMLLYTGSAIVGGKDELRQNLEQKLPPIGCSLTWREIDPDIFGEELEKPAYRDVERIAAIGAVIEKHR